MSMDRRGFLTGALQCLGGALALQVVPGLNVASDAVGATMLWTPSPQLALPTRIRPVKSILQITVSEMGSDVPLLREQLPFEAVRSGYACAFPGEILSTGDGYYLHEFRVTTHLRHVDGLPPLTRTVSSFGHFDTEVTKR